MANNDEKVKEIIIEKGVNLEEYKVNKEIKNDDYDKSLSVKCYNGTFVGLKNGNVISYKGIPYAQPPIGNLRYKPSLKVLQSDKIYEAYYFGKTSLQSKCETEKASLYEQGEDCLTLNIWLNKLNNNKNKPVMVFIHGGAFGWGGTSDPLYEGTNLINVHEDIILVTINYRVNLLGFLNLSMLEGGENYKQSGNLGLLDQVRALEWIHENIQNFGGDQNNVTIFGESAGGTSVSVLPFISGTKGLFKHIIAESGSMQFTASTENCLKISEKLFKKLKIKSVDELLKLSEKQMKEIIDNFGYYNFPERDGIVIPKDLYSALDEYDLSHIDFILGTNKDEYRYWIGDFGGYDIYEKELPKLYDMVYANLEENDKKNADTFLKMLKDNELWNKTEFFNEQVFRIPAITQAEKICKKGGKIYNYYWTFPSSIDKLKACHAVELSHVFNNVKNGIYSGGNYDLTLAAKVQKMWTNFARNGNPSLDEHIWNCYDLDKRETMILGEKIYVEKDLLAEQRKLMSPLAKYYINCIDVINEKEE